MKRKQTQILFTPEMVVAILKREKTQTRRVVSHKVMRALIGDEGNAGGCPYGDEGDLLWVRETWQLVREVGQLVPSIEHPPEPDVWWEAFEGKMPSAMPDGWMLAYLATDTDLVDRVPWRPCIFMPRWACRLFLELTAPVRFQRLQDITTEDILAEGIRYPVIVDTRRDGTPVTVPGPAEPSDEVKPFIEIKGKYPAAKYLEPRTEWELMALPPAERHAALLDAYWASTWNRINAGRGYPWEINPWVWALTFQRREGEADGKGCEDVQEGSGVAAWRDARSAWESHWRRGRNLLWSKADGER